MARGRTEWWALPPAKLHAGADVGFEDGAGERQSRPTPTAGAPKLLAEPLREDRGVRQVSMLMVRSPARRSSATPMK